MEANSKHIGFLLLGAAALLALNGRRTGVPKIGGVKRTDKIDAEHQKRVNEVFEMIKNRHRFVLEENSTSTTSSYHTLVNGNAVIKLRLADHETSHYSSFNVDKRIFAEIDLVTLTKYKSTEEAFEKAVSYIQRLKEIADRDIPGKKKPLATYRKRMPDL